MTTKALILLLISQSLHASNIAFVPDDKKIALSEEIFNKLSKEHYVQELSNDFNHKYIEHLIDELDGNKRYFTKYEVNRFLSSAKIFNSSKNAFDIKAAYKIINLYFNRLIDFQPF